MQSGPGTTKAMEVTMPERTYTHGARRTLKEVIQVFQALSRSFWLSISPCRHQWLINLVADLV